MNFHPFSSVRLAPAERVKHELRADPLPSELVVPKYGNAVVDQCLRGNILIHPPPIESDLSGDLPREKVVVSNNSAFVPSHETATAKPIERVTEQSLKQTTITRRELLAMLGEAAATVLRLQFYGIQRVATGHTSVRKPLIG
jgi:hypothetical protein